jgi:hypothetical protein
LQRLPLRYRVITVIGCRLRAASAFCSLLAAPVQGITGGLIVGHGNKRSGSVRTRAGRPLAKSLVKGGIALYQMGREAVAGAGEKMGARNR